MDKVSDDANRIRILSSEYSAASDIILASVITTTKSLSKSLSVLRDITGITKFTDLTAEHSLEALVKFLESKLNENQDEQVGLWAVQCMDTYRLSSNWFTHLKILAVTNCLLVPDDPPVTLVPPRSKSNIVDIVNRPTSEQPLIVFNYDVSVKDLQEYLSNHGKEYKFMLSSLPKKKRTKIKTDTLIIGHAAWILKDSEPSMSWPKMLRVLDNGLLEKVALSEVELRNYYNAYIRAVTKIENK